MIRSLALLVLVVTAVPAAAQVTLDGLLSAPFPSEMAAAPAGGHVAWVLNARGARNVWVASAPDFTARQITSYEGDDGQEIASLTWAPDGRSVLYVRGSGPNRQNEVPNPAFAPDGVEQEIWAVDLASGPPRKLAAGSSPAVSSRGAVAYLARGQVWATDVAGAQKPAKLFTSRGQARELRWSPDGSRLAFASARGDHNFIGVFDAEGKSLRYLDPSVDLDGSPVWSPDGRRLAFVRIPSSRETVSFGPRREAEPWSIRTVDAATGRGAEIWKAGLGPGSVYQGVGADAQILWADGDRLVFPWERDGWLHLYSVPATGGRAILLTPGAFEVEHVALAPDRRSVIYSSNQDDIDRRHLWSVAVGGGAPVQLTRGNGAEWQPAPVDGSTIAFLRSDGRQAAHAAIRTGETVRPLAPETMPPGFPAARLVEPQQVIFAAADGMPIHGQLFLPRDVKPGEKRPGVVFFHGGSRRQMLLAWHYMAYYHHTYALNQFLASRGYVVLSVNFRSGTGYGLNFREALNYGATGASEFNDVLGAGLYLRSRADVDPARIGAWGGSYGGFLTAHALARASDLYAAGVDIHGVHDWNVGIRTFIPTYAPAPEIERRNFSASPLAYVDGWKSPVLLVHGDDDRNVSFSETVTLAAELRKRNITSEQLVIPDEVHSFLRHDSWLRVFQAAADFFDRHLKGRRINTN